MKEFIARVIVGGVARVPSPVKTVLRTKTAKAGCVVIGAAFTAYGQGECSGTQAIIGASIGAAIIFQRLATEKAMQVILGKIGQ